LVRSEAHEDKGAENEHRGYWNQPAKIQPSGVRGFALGGLCLRTRAGCSGFRLRRNACRAQGNCWDWPCTRESWFERKIGWVKLLACICAHHCGELFAATWACGEMKLVVGGFVGSERLVEIRGEEFDVRAIAGGTRIARKTSPEQAVHCVFVVLRRHDAILLL
jgi:hypothetical protein